jgi:outer membrane receptor protein involved in Fe transport
MDRHAARIRTVVLSTASLFCLAAAAPAFAQDDGNQGSPPAAEDSNDDGQTITVTGSRLRTNGMQAPVPVTVLPAEELQSMAPGNLIEGLAELPQFYNSQTPASPQGWFTRGGYGNLDMRGLGINRTLTLLNGRRIVSNSAFGGVDINVFPEAMIASVETVTGGASAAYGTDAVAGVTNFILDTKFTGVRAEGQWGETTRGDSKNWEGSISAGIKLGDRGHLLVSGEIFSQDGVHDFRGRDWYQSWGTLVGPDGKIFAAPNVVSSGSSFDGIISSPNALINGLQFTSTGATAPFVVGRPSYVLSGGVYVPNGTGTPGAHQSITAGGSGEDLAAEVQTVYPDVDRNSQFAYADYELADGFTVFAQYIRGQNKTFRYNTPRGSIQGSPTAVTIFQDNAFLPQSLRDTMVANSIASFTLRRTGSIEDIGQMWLKDNNVMQSWTGGFTWDIGGDGFMGGWQVDAYYQFGKNTRIWKQYGLRVDRLFAAVDAVRDPSGNIVCRVSLNAGGAAAFPGCQPLNLFGRGNASPGAVDYVVGSEPGQSITSPIFYADSGYTLGETHSFTTEDAKVNRTFMRQHLGEITFSGTVWDGWAGPITMAYGGSYRKERIQQIVEDVTNPAADHSTFRPVMCNNAAIGLRGVSPPDCANTVGVQFSKVSNIRGFLNVKEAFAETLIPLLKDAGIVDSAALHGAVRWADYSGSGTAWAYKTGLEIGFANTIRLRGTYSRDVRAGNLSERFDKTGGSATITDPKYPGDGVITVTRFSGGNPNVRPEKADTFTAGLVFTPTDGIPGLSASVDWYDVKIKGAIAQLGNQAVVNRCFAGDTEFCSLITRDTGTDRIILVGDVFVNVAQARVRGVDYEIGYRTNMNLFGGQPEALNIRVLASQLFENSQTSAAGLKIDRAGQTGIQQSDGVPYALPKFRATGNLTYNYGGFTFFLQGRYIGSGTWENQLTQANTIIGNRVESAFYTDVKLSYRQDLGDKMSLEFFGQMTNLFDTDPPVTPYYSAFLGYAQQYNPALFDALGRRFTVGAKFGF